MKFGRQFFALVDVIGNARHYDVWTRLSPSACEDRLSELVHPDEKHAVPEDLERYPIFGTVTTDEFRIHSLAANSRVRGPWAYGDLKPADGGTHIPLSLGIEPTSAVLVTFWVLGSAVLEVFAWLVLQSSTSHPAFFLPFFYMPGFLIIVGLILYWRLRQLSQMDPDFLLGFLEKTLDARIEPVVSSSPERP